MKTIHLYDIDDPDTCKALTGAFLNSKELMSGNFPIPKECFTGTELYLRGYTGKWYIEIRQCKYEIWSEPYAKWKKPASIYLVLEDIEE